MWISKHVWAQLQDLIRSYDRETQRLQSVMDTRTTRYEATIEGLRAQIMTVMAEAAPLRERSAALLFRIQILTKNLNQVQSERDQFLTRIVSGLTINTPHLGYEPVLMPPGVTFEDVGDVAAAHYGLDGPGGASEPLPEDEIEGLAGQVVESARVVKG